MEHWAQMGYQKIVETSLAKIDLMIIQILQERNKPKQPPKKPKAAPFFLPTIAGIETKFDNSKKDDKVQQVRLI